MFRKANMELCGPRKMTDQSDFQEHSGYIIEDEKSNLENAYTKERVPKASELNDVTKANRSLSISLPEADELSPLESPNFSHGSHGSLTSELVRNYFLRDKNQRNKQKMNDRRDQMATTKDDQECIEQKITYLEQKIYQLHGKNKQLESKVKEMERNVKLAAQEKKAWELEKASELEKFESYKNLQILKLKKERKILEKQSRAFVQIPQKWERRAIELLKFKLAQLQDENLKKESRWRLDANRLRKLNQDLIRRTHELEEEIKRYGMRLLDDWDAKDIILGLDKKGYESTRQENFPSKNNADESKCLHSDSETHRRLGIHNAPNHHIQSTTCGSDKSVKSIALVKGFSTSSMAIQNDPDLEKSNGRNSKLLLSSKEVMQDGSGSNVMSCYHERTKSTYSQRHAPHPVYPVLKNKGFIGTELAVSSNKKAISSSTTLVPHIKAGNGYCTRVSYPKKENAEFFAQEHRDKNIPYASAITPVCDKEKLSFDSLPITLKDEQSVTASDTGNPTDFLRTDTSAQLTHPESDMPTLLGEDGNAHDFYHSSSQPMWLLFKAFPTEVEARLKLC